MLQDWTHEGFLFSTEKSRLDVPYIHRFLAEQSYWAKGVPIQIVKRSIENSLAIGIYQLDSGAQVGFARVVTDYATFAYLGDVFVDEKLRGKGLSKKLMEYIFTLDGIKSFRRFILATSDAHSLYAKYGFKPLHAPDRFMEIHNRDVYQLLKASM